MFKEILIVFAVFLSSSYGFHVGSRLDLKPGGRIVGGIDAAPQQFPFLVSVQYAGSHNCGGGILNKKWILTAAHCVYGYATSVLTVVVGTVNLKEGGITYGVKKTIAHPNWDSWNIKFDVGLIQLDGELEFNDDVRSIKLLKEEVNIVPCTAAGWGRTSAWGPIPDHLQHINLTTISRDECQTTWAPHNQVDGDIEICTLTIPSEGVCNGDSGSPLIYKGKAIGIVSWGNPCANGLPDVYVRVSAFRRWILETINQDD